MPGLARLGLLLIGFVALAGALGGWRFSGVDSAAAEEDCLQSGVPINGAALAVGAWAYYCIDVPGGATNLVVTVTNVTGDPDLYLRNGAKPTQSTWDCASLAGSFEDDERCEVLAPEAGTWWIGVLGFGGAQAYVLTATATGGALPCHALTSSVVVGVGVVSASPASNCAGGYTHGTEVQLTATPAFSYRFSHWVPPASYGDANPLALTMTAARSVGAWFEMLWDADIDNSGTVTLGDALLLRRTLANDPSAASDCDFDGQEDADDVLCVLKHLAGIPAVP